MSDANRTPRGRILLAACAAVLICTAPAAAGSDASSPGQGGFGAVNTLVLAGYLAAMVAVGFYFSRREKSTDDFFLAGRRIPW